MLNTITNTEIYTVDALYYEAELAAIHIIREKDRIAIVDTGTQYSVPQIKHTLEELKLNFSNVDLIILTHIHLDHAGGASSLMNLCENAQLVVHPKGARHMVDPSKLVAGASAVYGKERFAKLYGEIGSIDAARIVQPTNGETIDLAGRSLTFIDTPGHANHHHCIFDPLTNSVFTGDTLGVSYKALRNENYAFVMPTTTPIQFNPQALHKSIDKVMSYNPDMLYLTHYSALKPNLNMIAGLHEQIDDFVMLTQQISEVDCDLGETLEMDLTDYLVTRCMNEISNIDEETALHWIKMDARLNAQGLAFWWENRREATVSK